MIALPTYIPVLLASVLCLPAFAADDDLRSQAGESDAASGQGTKAQFEQLLSTYQQRLATSDIDAVLDLYSADPVFMPEYAPPASGRQAVRKAYEWVFATLKLNGHFVVHEAEVLGDTAWVRTTSTGRFTVIASGVEGDLANSELFLFKRQNGAWKIHRYIFTSSAPLPH
jgi:uncharacterized protein (TIGR02246 family)